MRVTRTIAALVALLLTAALPMLATGSAGAATEDRVAAMKTRDITFQFRAQNRTYKFQGVVKPKSKSKNITVKLLRATCKKCKYKPFRSTTTNKRARYDFTGLKKTGWFTIKIPASKGFQTSYAGKSIHVFLD